jgi:hypothetical protein
MKNKNKCAVRAHNRADNGFRPLNEKLVRKLLCGLLILGLIEDVSMLFRTTPEKIRKWETHRNVKKLIKARDIKDKYGIYKNRI